MASPPSAIEIEEAKCSICLEWLTDPAVLDCGHSFCQGCITKYCDTWEALEEALECPACKVEFQKGDFRPNWQLANLVEKMKHLPLSSGKEDLHVRHKEKLHLFCKENEKLMCFVSERSPEHRRHTTLILEEAAQQYKADTASGCAVEELCEEATCFICLDYFRDPVAIAECDHNFCRSCLTKNWEELGAAEASCPVCRGKAQPRNLWPNRQLANMVEILKKINLLGGSGEEVEEGVCKKHQEHLKLFCQNDKILICVVCDRSKEHKDHEVIPVEEASGEYKDKLWSCLESLKEKRKRTLAWKANVEKESRELLEQTGTEREEIVAECRQIRQFLEEREKLLLAQVEEVEKEIERERDEHLARLSVELSSLENVIREMEEKIQQPAMELLQDVRGTLQRCEEEKKEKSEDPVAFSPALKWRIWDICDLNVLLKGVANQFRGTLMSGFQLHRGKVTLDPDTAHPQLRLSEDQKSLKWRKKAQDLPNNPERFDLYLAALGYEGFTGGRHFWEVTVERGGNWVVGVARQSVKRKGKIPLDAENGFWCLWKVGDLYHSMLPFPLSVSSDPQRIRVTLNYTGRQVAFFDADKATLLFLFSEAFLPRDTLQPFFIVAKNGCLSISP